MAISGFNGSNVLRKIDSSISDNFPCPPLTISAWVYYSQTPVAHTIACVARSNTNRFASIAFRFNPSGVFYVAHTSATTGRFLPQTPSNGSGFTTGQWIFVSASLDNTGVTSCWVNSGKIYSSLSGFATNTTISDMNTGAVPWDRLSIGTRFTTATNEIGPTGMYVAEVAFWNVMLSNEEIITLANGIKPTQIQPQNLISYSPGIRNLATDLKGITYTVVGGLQPSEHPRRYG